MFSALAAEAENNMAIKIKVLYRLKALLYI
jgi:hypothetical protein